MSGLIFSKKWSKFVDDTKTDNLNPKHETAITHSHLSMCGFTRSRGVEEHHIQQGAYECVRARTLSAYAGLASDIQ